MDTDTCSDGTPIVQCFVNPCENARCPNVPEAECEPNYCGTCAAVFYDEERNDVTEKCRDSGISKSNAYVNYTRTSMQ